MDSEEVQNQKFSSKWHALFRKEVAFRLPAKILRLL